MPQRLIALTPVAALATLALAFGACSSTSGEESDDAGTDTADAGPVDAGKPDAGKVDAGVDAGPVDAGEADAGGEELIPCGEIDELGDCSGNVVRWCDSESESLATFDCTTDLGEDDDGNPVTGECAILPNFGSWCALAANKTCAFEDEDGGEIVFACGTSAGLDANLACDVDLGCQPTTTTCTYPEEDDFVPVCDGTRLVLDCTEWNQQVVLDCAGEVTGGTGCQDATCIGIGAGGYCDDELFFCDTGLQCNADYTCE